MAPENEAEADMADSPECPHVSSANEAQAVDDEAKDVVDVSQCLKPSQLAHHVRARRKLTSATTLRQMWESSAQCSPPLRGALMNPAAAGGRSHPRRDARRASLQPSSIVVDAPAVLPRMSPSIAPQPFTPTEEGLLLRHRASQPSLQHAAKIHGIGSNQSPPIMMKHHIPSPLSLAQPRRSCQDEVERAVQVISRRRLLPAALSSDEHGPAAHPWFRTSSNPALLSMRSPVLHHPRSLNPGETPIQSNNMPGSLPEQSTAVHRGRGAFPSPVFSSSLATAQLASTKDIVARGRLLKHSHLSDLSNRFQRHNQELSTRDSLGTTSNESTPSRTEESENSNIDPVYLALKEATGKYGGGSRRSSSSNMMPQYSATPSPRNLSTTSLYDSGYADVVPCGSGGVRGMLAMLGSTPHLNQHLTTCVGEAHFNRGNHSLVGQQPPSGNGSGPQLIREPARRPKLNEKMKSLSLDCAEMPPMLGQTPLRSRAVKIDSKRGAAISGESLEAMGGGGSASPSISTTSIGGTPSGRKLPSIPTATASASKTTGTHVVIHEYVATEKLEEALFLGDRVCIMDGDENWLHGYKATDPQRHIFTFPATCVTKAEPNEQAMKLNQNVNLIEYKIRLYRDQVVFAQPDSLKEGKILVRNERRGTFYVPLQFLTLL